ncbi:MAG: hypothetical protein JXQ90_11965 [Cyclobacteriaceae bacterium]
MRVGTLARKIKIKPSELQQFFEDHSIALPSGTNTKLTLEQEALAIEHFSPDLLVDTAETSIIEEPEVVVEITPEADDEPEAKSKETQTEVEEIESTLPTVELDEGPTVYDEVKQDEVDLSVGETEEHSEETSDAEIIEEPVKTLEDFSEEELAELTESELKALQHDVVRAPKVTLQGLTVKGKIDLPEPKQVEKSEEEEDESTKKGRQPKGNKDRKSRKKKDYNPLAADRKRKAREAEKRKAQETKRQKELRRKRYEESIQAKTQSPKPKKSKKKKTAQQQVQNKPVYSGNALQRFWQWLNT